MKNYFNNLLYKNSFFIILSSVLNAIYGFVFWITAARLFTIESVGFATVLISSIGLVVLFSRFGLDFSIIRFLPLNDKSKVFNTSVTITTIASFLVGTLYIISIQYFSPSLSFLKEPQYATIFIALGVLESVNLMTGRAFLAARKGELYFYQNIFLALRVPLLMPLVLLGTLGIFGSIGISFFAATIFALIFLKKINIKISPKIDATFLRKSMRFSFWSYISSILSTAPTLILPIMILNMLGEIEAAQYYIAFSLINPILIVPNALGTSLFVEGSYGEELSKNAIKAIIATIFVLSPAVILLYLYGDTLLGLLNKDYIDSIGLLRILALSSFFVAIYSIFIPIQNVLMKVESLVKINLLRFILLLGLSQLLITKFGVIGVGYSWMITYIIIAFIIAYILLKEKK